MKGTICGKLTVISFPIKRNGKRYLTVKCECGTEKDIRIDHIIHRHTKSCGKCDRSKRCITHGLTYHPLYSVWLNMKNRCYNENVDSYKNYGGRGITMCKEWLGSFRTFYDWSIENGWQKGLEIDRRENNGPYEPSNCRYVTCKENARNRRNTLRAHQIPEIIKLYATGDTTLDKIGKAYGVGATTISAIVNKQHWV